MRHLVAILIATGLLVVDVPWAEAQERDGRQRQVREREAGEGRSNRPRRRREDKAPKLGQVAPAFKLQSLDGKSEVELASFKGNKPVVLIFGSYT